MNDRPSPPPSRPAADRRSVPWLKLGGIALVALALLGIASSLFGNGMGSPDESRRTRHPAGFSMCTPLGWDATVYQRDARGTDTIRITPDRSTGRQTILQATRLGAEPKFGPTAVDTTFQGKPATLEVASTRYDWVWQVSFERDHTWYHVQITSPIALDPKGDPLVAFANSFRTEPAIGTATTTTHDAVPSPAASQP